MTAHAERTCFAQNHLGEFVGIAFRAQNRQQHARADSSSSEWACEKTSSAPAASACSTKCPRISALISSRFVSSTAIVSISQSCFPVASSCRCFTENGPQNIRAVFCCRGCRGRNRSSPRPNPRIGPNSSTNSASNAAPVGVTNSCGSSHCERGMPLLRRGLQASQARESEIGRARN